MEQVMNEATENQMKKSYKPLWIMIFLFALPYVGAMYVYLNRDKLELEQSNYGTLVSPVRATDDLTLTALDNSVFKLTSLRGKWVLLTLGSSECGSFCQDNMYKIRQIRKAVGQDKTRIERLFVLTNVISLDDFNEKLDGYHGMTVVHAKDNKLQKLLATFSINQFDRNQAVDGIYIIDPLGNYMMAYPNNADASEMLKDVRRLLKVSKTG